MKTKIIKVLDFTPIPGGRFRENGGGSAQAFFEDNIKPILDSEKPKHLILDFNGTWGYGPSFTSQLGIYLTEYFKSVEAVKRKIEIIAPDDPAAIESFWSQLEDKKE